MKQKKLLQFLIKILDAFKADHIQILNIKNFFMTDYIIISEGTSSKHIYAIGENIKYKIKYFNYQGLCIEGFTKNTDWILIHIEYITIHIMLKKAREYYNLSNIKGLDITNSFFKKKK